MWKGMHPELSVINKRSIYKSYLLFVKLPYCLVPYNYVLYLKYVYDTKCIKNK